MCIDLDSCSAWRNPNLPENIDKQVASGFAHYTKDTPCRWDAPVCLSVWIVGTVAFCEIWEIMVVPKSSAWMKCAYTECCIPKSLTVTLSLAAETKLSKKERKVVNRSVLT